MLQEPLVMHRVLQGTEQMANALDQIQHKSPLLCSVCLFISHKQVALGVTGHYGGTREQIAAGQGWRGEKDGTTKHAFTNIDLLPQGMGWKGAFQQKLADGRTFRL